MRTTRVKPPALSIGDTVGVVAPAAAIDREYLERGVTALSAMGFRVKVSARALDRSGILAGEDPARVRELHDYFADSSVRAIFAARGGYGCGRLLSLIDWHRLAQTPKPFIGYSDETFLLNPLVDRAGMTAIHGPMIAMDFARGLSTRSVDHLRALLTGEVGAFTLDARDRIHRGTAEGELVGGCLSVIVAMLATPYAPDFRGKILFLEDTGERAYRIDRMLVQLRQAGVLGDLAGLVFGAIRPVDGDAEEAKLISRFISEETAGLGIPVIAGIEVGHGSENLALPVGVKARLEADACRLRVLEPAVAA